MVEREGLKISKRLGRLLALRSKPLERSFFNLLQVSKGFEDVEEVVDDIETNKTAEGGED